MKRFGALAPAVAVELASHRVSAAAIEIRGGRPVVAMHATEALPPGALVPALVGPNMPDRTAVASALGRVLEQMGRPRRIGLILPDPVAKISLVRFAQVPARTQDLDQLIRWQVRKAAPFPIDEGLVSYVPSVHTPDGHEFIVSVARRAAIEEYEAVCEGAGAHAGLVDIATFNLINALLAGSAPPRADWLLINVATDYTSIAIMRSADLIFFRSRGADGEGSLADLVHQTAMYLRRPARGRRLHPGRPRWCVRQPRPAGKRRARSPESRGAARHGGRSGRRPGDGGADRPDWRVGGTRRYPDAARRPVAARERRSRMIRTNLSTRPFYNEAAVRFWLGVIGALVVAATIFNVQRLIHHSRSDTEQATQAARDEQRARDLRADATRLRASVDTAQIEAASIEARAANELIDRRTFSWTEVFNRFEATLPADVRITSLRHTLDHSRGILLTISILARDVENVNQFIENLEATKAFSEVLAAQELVNPENGQLEVILQAVYHPSIVQRPPAVETAATVKTIAKDVGR